MNTKFEVGNLVVGIGGSVIWQVKQIMYGGNSILNHSTRYGCLNGNGETKWFFEDQIKLAVPTFKDLLKGEA